MAETYINHIYPKPEVYPPASTGQEGYYGTTGGVSKMSTSSQRYRWRVLSDGHIYRIHGNFWTIREDESLASYKSQPASTKDYYVVAQSNARYVQYDSDAYQLHEYGANSTLVCYGDSVTDGKYPYFIPRLGNGFASYAALDYGSSGGSAQRICKICTGFGDDEGTYHDISQEWESGVIKSVLILSGINNRNGGTTGQTPTIIEGDTVNPLEALLRGESATVNGQTVATASDYYAMFANSPTGQQAFMIEWLRASYPGIRIILLKYHLITSDRYAQSLACDDTVDALVEMYGVESLSLRDLWTADNAGTYLADGLHPNEDGSTLIAQRISSYLTGTTTYTATFVADGVTVGTVDFHAGATSSITEPAVPAKTGYTSAWEPYTLGNADITVHAVYTANTYHITFIADGQTVAVVPYQYGATSITEPAVPPKDGYTGAWPSYSLGHTNQTVTAVYTPVVVRILGYNGGKGYTEGRSGGKAYYEGYSDGVRYPKEG